VGRCPRKGICTCTNSPLRYRREWEVLISNNGHKQAEEEVQVPLGERLWFIALMMFVFFPAGLVLFWRHEFFPPMTKWLVTVVVLATVIWAVFAIGPR
jgi:hypothetical protein